MITSDTADQLEALALTIFNPQVTPNPNPALGDTWGQGTGLHAQDDATDAKLLGLIAEVAKTIDGRTVATGFKYTLNITNALQLRPKHWYMQVMELDGSGYGWPCSVAMEYHSQEFPATGGVNSFGGTLGLATCACICNAWATIIRRWLQGQYPLAVNQP
jgi:hypothetical protein